MQVVNNFFDKYLALRKEVDMSAISLAGEHFGKMNCKAGCSSCCQDYSILPVEFFAIKSELTKNNISLIDIHKNPRASECVFLRDNICTIYEYRPIICRTHGLPLIYMGDEQWELSVCDLNFRHEFDDYFTIDNCFPMDKYNSEMYLLNMAFIDSVPEKELDKDDLIPVYKLVSCCQESPETSQPIELTDDDAWGFEDNFDKTKP